MKRLLIILFLLPLASMSQMYIGQTKMTVVNRGAFKTDSVFTLPVRDTSFPAWLGAPYKTGSIVLKGTLPYYYNGSAWSAFSGTGSTFDSTYIYQALDDTASAIRGDFPSLTGYLLKSDSTIFSPNYRVDTTRSGLESRLLSSSTTSQQNGYFTKTHYYSLASTYYLELRNNNTTATAHRSLGIDIGDVDRTLTLTGNTSLSGTNTGDQTSIVGITGSLSDFNGALTGDDFATGGGTATGTNTGDNAANTTSNTYADGKVADAINNGTTTIAPSQNAVFDALALKANIASPTFTGTVTIPTPWTLGATSVTSTGTQLNYLNAATGTTGTTSTNLVFSTSPVLTTPTLGVASATSLNTGTTLNGVLFAKSTTDIALASTAHALTVGGESNSTNLALGEYSSGVGLQARNNGAVAATYINPLGGDIQVGSSTTGVQNFIINNTDAGAASYIEMGLRNGASSADGLLFRTLGTGFGTSGMNTQDGSAILTSTNLSGGLSIGTQASASFRVFTNNTLRTTWDASTGNISTTGQVLSSGGGLGYTTGAGGTVTQITSRATGVTLNKLCGNITMFSAAQAANAIITFTLTNSFIAATDYLLVQHISATNGGAWVFSTVCGAGSATISITNSSNASITSATPLRFFILKASTN